MITYKNTQFIGKEVTCNEDFKPLLDLMNDKAKELNLKIYVTSSLRYNTNVKGAIVTPAKMSNHLVGHAIDCNIVDVGKWWNSSKLKNPKGKVLEFIEYCRSVGIRWGGDFNTPDTVHFDSGLNLKNPKKYKEILKR